MRRTIIVLASTCVFLMQVFSQETGKKATDQLNVQAFASNTSVTKKSTISKEEDLSIYNLSDYKYTLTPQSDKDYKKYQVIKLDGLDNATVLIGMITNSLDRETRYIELGGVEATAKIREILDQKADYVFVNPIDKQYFMLPDGSYRYIDGRELVGDKKVLTYLEKGKPITAATFYFALKDKGLIQSDMSIRTFISLSLDEKLKVLNMDLYASTKVNATAVAEK